MSGIAVRHNLGWDSSEGVLKVAMLWWDTNTLAWVKASGGGVGPDVNVTNLPADPSTATKQTAVIDELSAFNGTTGDGTVALASANTWYAVPVSVPAIDYFLVVALENKAGIVRWSYNNGGTPSVTNGNKAPRHLAVRMAANASLYFGSSTAGDDVNYTYVEKT